VPQDKIISKTVLFDSSSYTLRGWVSVCCAAFMAAAYFCGFSPTLVLLVYIAALFWGGELFIRGALGEAAKFYFGFNALAAVSMLGAFAFFILNNFCGAGVGVSGDILLPPLIFALANFVKAAELGRVKGAFAFIESADNFIPRSAIKIEGGERKKLFSSEIEPGDTILVERGARVPLDAIVLKTAAEVDEYLLTGNVLPTVRQKGAVVYAASVNKGPAFTARVISLKSTSRIAKILRALKENEKRKLFSSPSPLESCATAVLAFFILLGALQAAWGIYWEGADKLIYRAAVFFFILACAGPAGYMAAALLPLALLKKGAARGGVMINNEGVLKTLTRADKVFIDKTGTLTSGRLEVAEVLPAAGVKPAEVIKAALLAQRDSGNIFETALKEYTKKDKIKSEKIISCEAFAGSGVLAATAKDTVIAGRAAWLKEMGISAAPARDELGKTAVHVAKNGAYLGCVYFSDRLRANAGASVAYVKELGKKVCLISGDNPAAVQAAAAKAGIEEYYGNMFPQDKAAKIAAQANLGESIIMIGDGFNDILALLKADGAIAFAPAGRNTFNSWVDIAVSSRDFGVIGRIFNFDKRQKTITRQNVLFAVLSGVCAVWFTIYFNNGAQWWQLPVFTAAAAAFAALNSARLLKW
jgi:P-type E1-E2 ATPase